MLRNLILMSLESVRASGKQVRSQTEDCGSDTMSSGVESAAGLASPKDAKANVGKKTQRLGEQRGTIRHKIGVRKGGRRKDSEGNGAETGRRGASAGAGSRPCRASCSFSQPPCSQPATWTGRVSGTDPVGPSGAPQAPPGGPSATPAPGALRQDALGSGQDQPPSSDFEHESGARKCHLGEGSESCARNVVFWWHDGFLDISLLLPSSSTDARASKHFVGTRDQICGPTSSSFPRLPRTGAPVEGRGRTATCRVAGTLCARLLEVADARSRRDTCAPGAAVVSAAPCTIRLGLGRHVNRSRMTHTGLWF